MQNRLSLRQLLFGIGFCVALPMSGQASNGSPEAKTAAAEEQFFEQHVRPILAARCLGCHGAQKQEGGIRLDSREAVFRPREDDPVVMPGSPQKSRLWEVIRYSDDDIQMPPSGKMPENEIATLTTWIEHGAPFPLSVEPTEHGLEYFASPKGLEEARSTFWALQPLNKSAPPAVSDEAWVRTPLDRYILASLDEAGLTPNPPADRATWLRRVTYDLVGLPPTAEEFAAFEQDLSPQAESRVIERLLSSPRYGERWGRHWLDVARYADTKGYVFTDDPNYHFAFTYRDYVIRAFNEDLPFDRFILEQLAADQLERTDDRSLAAMGFLTLGRRFSNKKEDIIDDRIDVVTRGLLGLTVACARCHDHKYDPIPTADYYSLFGVFENSVEPAEPPIIAQPEESETVTKYEAELARLRAKIPEAEQRELVRLHNILRKQTPDYLVGLVRLKGKDLSSLKKGSAELGDLAPLVLKAWQRFLTQAEGSGDEVFAPWHALAELNADEFTARAPEVLEQFVGTPAARSGHPLVTAALRADPPSSMEEVARVYGRLLMEHGGTTQEGNSSSNASTAKSSSSDSKTLPSADPASPAHALWQVLNSEGSPVLLTLEEGRPLFDRQSNSKIAKVTKAAAAYQFSAEGSPIRAMVLNDTPEPRPTKILQRGNPGRPGAEVPRQFLQALQSGEHRPFTRGSGRLELAQAIIHPANPLTARVIVNRVWMHHFGRGLVSTPSDFGSRGEPPSHPALLDDLARRFQEQGWSIKSLHREILLSAAFRQSSAHRETAFQIDPENKLLWRMNRRRLEFEPYRDSLLAVAGQLDFTSGGRAVDLFQEPFPHRRTIYGRIDRQDLPGTLRTFDFTNPDATTAQRPQTMSPQQALFGMNSPFVAEQARALARREEVTQAVEPAQQVESLYRLVFGRTPEPTEKELGLSFLVAPAASEQEVPHPQLSRLEQYAQALLLTNEFTFVD
ncbi:DUF1553 domain-containing protein [Planctomicrobium sp. SH664]|uniref:PSD1 and planctomycete cytochrome C domain-containing protein n=1 Tax=Planctomicrobium sp. SH664 TaxID=3448125 RepID=UPI003F5C0645